MENATLNDINDLADRLPGMGMKPPVIGHSVTWYAINVDERGAGTRRNAGLCRTGA